MKNGTLNDFEKEIKNTLKGVADAYKEEYLGIPMQNPVQLCPKTKMGLAGLIAGGLITLGTIGAITFGAVKGFEYYLQHEAQSKVVYSIEGRPAIERRFDSNKKM